MTSINTNAVNRLVPQFKQLPVDDQIAALGQIYQEVAGSLPAPAMQTNATSAVEEVVKQVLEMREGGQIQFLQDVLSDVDRDEIALDTHPSKAMLELIPGDGIEPPIDEYKDLNATDRLLVWYYLASRMGDDFIALPSDYQVSDAAKEVLQALQSSGAEDKLNFLSQIV
jgi:hypothetical protein